MVVGSKRDTVLPQALWEGKGKNREAPLSRNTVEDSSTRFGVPIKPSVPSQHSIPRTSGRKPNYHQTYNIDQAGVGIIAIKDVEDFPICLLKMREGRNEELRKLKTTSHKNLVSLVDSFRSDGKIKIVYEYEHLAISLGCAAGTVQFSEADIATICKELLLGLRYIHSDLKISYGLLDCSNILLTYDGGLKLANIGDSLLKKIDLSHAETDIKALGFVAISLIDPEVLLRDPGETININSENISEAAFAFFQRTKISRSTDKLLKDDFIELANPGGAWSLKRHYFETLPLGIRIGSRVGGGSKS